MIRNKERIDLNITPKKIAQNSRNSWRLSGRDVGAQGQLTQGANWCSPETKYKSSRIAFYITSIAFKLKKTWNQIAEAYRLEPRSSCVNGNCRKYFYIHERQTDHNIQDARKEKKRIPQLWQVSVPNFQQGLVVWENTYQQKWMISWANPMIQKKACWGRIDLNITIGPGHDWIYHMTMMKHRDQRKKERKLLWHVGVQIKLSNRHQERKEGKTVAPSPVTVRVTWLFLFQNRDQRSNPPAGPAFLNSLTLGSRAQHRITALVSYTFVGHEFPHAVLRFVDLARIQRVCTNAKSSFRRLWGGSASASFAAEEQQYQVLYNISCNIISYLV